MIIHLVLFKPRADLTSAQRQSLADALTTAMSEIPTIRRVRVGTRATHGRSGYEALMTTNYSHTAMLEFDDMDGLVAYLQHPAHAALAHRFFAAFEEGLMYDFDVKEGEDGVRAVMQAT